MKRCLTALHLLFLAVPMAATPAIAEDNTWVVHACDIHDLEQIEHDYGSFPGLVPESIFTIETFQRRLCIRQFADNQRNYLKAPHSIPLEDDLLNLARRCGYWDVLPFSSFAYSYLILGQDSLETAPAFICDAALHPNIALAEIDLVRVTSADLRVRNLKQYGPNWDSAD